MFKNWRCDVCESEFDEPFYIFDGTEFFELLQSTREEYEKIEVVTFKANIDYSKCAICGKEASCVHHLNLDREDNRFNNLVPLCKECHGSFHGLLNALIGDVASQREAMSSLVDYKVPLEAIYSALLFLQQKFFGACERMHVE
jgi:5-methylcytosine-specific restriction endonuclease McrA